jgi:hypothetical protein
VRANRAGQGLGAASRLAIDRPRGAVSRPSRGGRSRNTRNGRSIIGRLRPGLRLLADLHRNRWRILVRGSRSSCTLSQCRILGARSERGRSGLGRSVAARAVRRLDGRGRFGRERGGQVQIPVEQIQGIRALRGLSAARVDWLGPSLPAAASRGRAERDRAASRATQAGDPMARELVAAVLAHPRGPALAENGHSTAKVVRAVRQSGRTRRGVKALRVPDRAAKARGQSAEPARGGSPNRALTERARAVKVRRGTVPGPRRAGSRSRATRESRAGREPGERVRARNGQGRAVRSRAAGGLRQN